MQSPLNNYTVAFDQPFNDEVVTESGVKLYRDVTFSPENFSQTNGTVTAVPRYNNREMDVIVGDQVFFSYLVVFDMELRDRDTPIHRNLLYYKQKNYWKVNNELIFFRVRGDEIKMLNGFMLLDIIEEEVQSSIVIPEHLKRQKMIGRARVVKSGDESVAEFGDTIFYDRRFIENYELFGRELQILKKERILAKL